MSSQEQELLDVAGAGVVLGIQLVRLQLGSRREAVGGRPKHNKEVQAKTNLKTQNPKQIKFNNKESDEKVGEVNYEAIDFHPNEEKNICEDGLKKSLLLSEDVQLECLSGDNLEELQNEKSKKKIKQRSKSKSKTKPVKPDDKVLIKEEKMEEKFKIVPKKDATDSTKNDLDTYITYVEDVGELDQIMSSMMQKIKRAGWECSICGRTEKDKGHLKQHIEAKHIEASHPCNQCGKLSPSRQALAMHKRRHKTLLFPEESELQVK